jgi:curved DNA-binding protein CbpA
VEDKHLARLPRPVEGVDMRRLPIGPEEAFVLSRVDGRSSEAEIAAATGLEAERVHDHLARLTELGAVRFGAGDDVMPPPRPERSSVPPGAKLSRPIIETSAETGDGHHHPAAALYDPAELDEDVDLDLPRKRRILDTFYRLDSMSHYELLNVERSADRKGIKAAYYEIVSVFHPDKYFGKRIGSFKPKLERVFSRLTEAHDVLTQIPTRDEYDRYLATLRKNEDFERLLSDERARALELDRARQRIEEEARIAERSSHNPKARPEPSAPPQPMTQEARKKALARKLGVSMPPARSSTPPPDKAAMKEYVAEELKRRYEQRLTLARDKQIVLYTEAADKALEEKNPVSAANALRIAVSLAPEDLALQARLEDVQQQANVELAQSYLDQARYEEHNGRLLEAALSYERAARGRPSSQIFERAAHCLLEGRGDLKKAGELARKAVSLVPAQSEPRLTLAKIYLSAGMRESALKEFERAGEISPGDDTIKDWIKRIRRGEV